MKFIALLFLFLFSSGQYMASAQETNKDAIIKEEVWKVVEDRNRTWVENNFEGHMAFYQPDFKRWTLHSKTLMTKDIFTSFWNDIKNDEKVINIDIEREEMHFLDGGHLAIAHYTECETYRRI